MKAVGRRVVLKILDVRPARTASGLYIPEEDDLTKMRHSRGEVVSLGRLAQEYFEDEIKVGDRVYIARAIGFAQKDFRVVDMSDIMSVADENDEVTNDN